MLSAVVDVERRPRHVEEWPWLNTGLVLVVLEAVGVGQGTSYSWQYPLSKPHPPWDMALRWPFYDLYVE
jgi:hypothetical protein